MKVHDKSSFDRAVQEMREHQEAEEREEQREEELEKRAQDIMSEVMTWAHVCGNMEAFKRAEDKMKADIKKLLHGFREVDERDE